METHALRNIINAAQSHQRRSFNGQNSPGAARIEEFILTKNEQDRDVSEICYVGHTAMANDENKCLARPFLVRTISWHQR